MPLQVNKYLHQIIAIALAICEETLLYPVCFTSFTTLLPAQQGFRFHIFFERLPSRRRMFLKTTLLHSHFNVLHGTFAFFVLLPVKVYSAVTQILGIPLFFLMEVSVVRLSTPLQEKNQRWGKRTKTEKSIAFPYGFST